MARISLPKLILVVAAALSVTNLHRAVAEKGNPPPPPLAQPVTAAATRPAAPTEAMNRPENFVPVQVQPPLTPPRELQPAVPTPTAAGQLLGGLQGAGITRSALGVSSAVISGDESRTRVTTDAGSLLFKSNASLGVDVQRRTPIVNDPRVRGQRIGQLLVGGSFWHPARLDLDTAVSKLDSSIIGDVVVIKGPYSALYGPGHSFINTTFLPSPRYEATEWHGQTSFNYQTNGSQWYGRQSVLGGASDWGVRIGYDHRTGNDYEDGAGNSLPSSYNARNADLALGFDLTPDHHFEFTLLRVDQTGVEFPGQIFDIRYLVTDAYELTYVIENRSAFDRLLIETWYNRTRFEGDAQRTGKRRQIPQLDDPLAFIGDTDADLLSTGYKLAISWGEMSGSAAAASPLMRSPARVPPPGPVGQPNSQPDSASAPSQGVLRLLSQVTGNPELGASARDRFGPPLQEATSSTRESRRSGPYLTLGSDLRYLDQELNEFDSFQLIVSGIPIPVAEGDNFPIPRSHWLNPGLFAEGVLPVGECLTIKAGSRIDWVRTDVDEIPRGLTPIVLREILGSSDLGQNFPLWAAFLEAEYQLTPHWTAMFGAGHSERAPTLTELYAAGPFLAILQQGFTSVAGNVGLGQERLWQVDVGLRADYGRFRGGINGFHAWINNYITYEAVAPLVGVPDALGIRFVNTELATLMGGAVYGEYDATCWLTPFATLKYVQGEDETRDGRGFIPGSSEEPLPGIAPLEARLGIRIHDTGEQPRWSVEFSARVVDRQGRVAASLLERPTAGFTVWDVRGAWQATKNMVLIAGVENFTDRNYREHLDVRTGRGVFQPGVNFYFGSEWRY